MSIADYNEVVQLWQKTEGVGLDNSDARPSIRRYLARNPGLSMVARDGKQLAGAVLCGHDGRRGYLTHLAVATEYRGRGIARELVRICLEKLKRTGIHKCNIHIFADNTRGEKFWKKIGWRKRPEVGVMQTALVPSDLKRCC
jgi:putative acetyltransferase